MLAFFRALQAIRHDARLLFVNRTDHAEIRSRASAAGIDDSRLEIRSAEFGQMPELVARMSAGMALIRPAYSKIASAPTKLGEYLGCGIPCLGNAGVGDMEQVLESRRVGTVLRGFSADQLSEGARLLLDLSRDPDIGARCRHAAEQLFSRDLGVAAYSGIYDRLACGRAK
jgi:hypothetical protein